jgi:hypothetical protein
MRGEERIKYKQIRGSENLTAMIMAATGQAKKRWRPMTTG